MLKLANWTGLSLKSSFFWENTALTVSEDVSVLTIKSYLKSGKPILECWWAYLWARQKHFACNRSKRKLPPLELQDRVLNISLQRFSWFFLNGPQVTESLTWSFGQIKLEHLVLLPSLFGQIPHRQSLLYGWWGPPSSWQTRIWLSSTPLGAILSLETPSACQLCVYPCL